MRRQVRYVGDKKFSRKNEYGYDEYILLDTSRDVLSVLEHIGKSGEKFDFLLVKLDKSGADYEEVWAGRGLPYVWTRVMRIK